MSGRAVGEAGEGLWEARGCGRLPSTSATHHSENRPNHPPSAPSRLRPPTCRRTFSSTSLSTCSAPCRRRSTSMLRSRVSRMSWIHKLTRPAWEEGTTRARTGLGVEGCNAKCARGAHVLEPQADQASAWREGGVG